MRRRRFCVFLVFVERKNECKRMIMKTGKISLVRVLSLLVFLLGFQSVWADVWDGVTKTPAKKQTIDGKDYYLIESAANLAWFSDEVNNSSAAEVNLNAKVVANFIDMNHKQFVPIAAGKGDKLYSGIFDGNHVVIKNLNISSDYISGIEKKYGQNIAFIAALHKGTVRNVILDSVYIKATTDIGSILNGDANKISVGTVVAWMKSGTVEGCYASGIVYNSGKGQAVGGIVGNADAGLVRDNLSIISIQISGSQAYVGGIIGQAKDNVKVESCVYDGGKFINDSTAYDGGVVGLRYDNNQTLFKNDYYDEGDVDKGAAQGSTNGIYATSLLNQSKIACILNEGDWDESDTTCSVEGVWSTGDHITNQGVSKNEKNETIFTIKFNANGGQFPADAKTVKYLRFKELVTGDEITIPTHAGDSVFWGWSMDPAATEPASSAVLDTVYKPNTVYAVWKKTVNVTFDFNNDVNPGSTTKKIPIGDPIIAVDLESTTYTDASSDVYYFVGWAKNKTDTDPLTDLGNAAEGKTYYAIWSTDATYTVTFDVQGKGSELQSQQIKKGNKASEPTPTAVGYTFGGWYTEAACQNAFDFNTAITKNVTLYAKWNVVSYTITYDMDGGENSEKNPGSYTIESETIVLDSAKTRKGFLFHGWYYDADFTQLATQITEGTFGAVTLYAKWTAKQYEVIYSAGVRGMGSVEIDYKPHGDTLTLSSEKYYYYNEDYRVSFLHEGWALSDGGSKEYDLGGLYGDDADVIFYPYWSKKVKVHYGSEDKDTLWVDVSDVESDSLVSNAISEALLSHDPVIDLPSKKSDDKYVYSLKWVSDSAAVYEPTFEKIEHKGKIIVAYGTGAQDTIHITGVKSKTDDELQELIKETLEERGIPLPTKAADSLYEYEFAKFVLNAETGIYEPFFAKSGNLLYKINFHLPEGAELTAEFEGYVYGQVTKLPTAVMKSDTTWVFKGWYTKPKGRGDRIRSMRDTDSGNKSLYPLFQKTIRYDANGVKGEIEVIYTDRAEVTITRALDDVIPANYTKGKSTFAFDKWVLKDGVYTATFKEVGTSFNVYASARGFTIEEAKLGARLMVLDLNGKVVKRGVISNESQRVEVPKSGSYTVRVGKQAAQVNVK